MAKELKFRAATMAGITKQVLTTGLSSDYNKVDKRTEKVLRFLEGTHLVKVDYTFNKNPYSFEIEISDKGLGKDGGLYHKVGEVGNLPTGEVFYVPKNAKGILPIQISKDTTALFSLKNCKIDTLLEYFGNKKEVQSFTTKIKKEPSMAKIVELGIGTENFPYVGVDVQDKKIAGTIHLALGRNDFLGGDNSPKKFKNKQNAVHKDILYHPKLIPNMVIKTVTIFKTNKKIDIIKSFKPTTIFAKQLI